MLKVGLFFGSFNPVHIGHLSIANYIWQYEEVDEVWMVISPQNPFKKKNLLWDENLRLRLLETALSGHPKIRACNIEFDLPKPSYTFNTMRALREKYPEHEFSIVIGEDILHGLSKWNKGKELIEENFFYVYPRTTSKKTTISLQKAKKIEAPLLNISSTYIRNSLMNGKDIRYLVGKDVAQLIFQLKKF